MPDSNRDRLSPAVTAIFVAVVAVLIALIIWDCAASYTQHRLEAERYTAEYAADAQKRIEQCGALVSGGDIAECVTEVVEASREHQRGERDLAAQRDMAQWAGWLLVVSGVGVVLLAATFYETLRTARAAEEAVSAASRSADISEQALERSSRPHMLVEKISFPNIRNDVDGHGDVCIKHSIMNYGSSPARVVQLSIQRHIGSLPETPYYPATEETDFVVPTGKGIGTIDEEMVPHRIDAAQRDAVLAGKMNLFVYGFVVYLDLVNKEHINRFLYVFVPGKTQASDRLHPIRVPAYIEYT